MGHVTPEQSEAFIQNAIQISNDLELGEPGDTPVGELIDNVSSVFGVSIKEGNDYSNCIIVDKAGLTFTVGYGGNDFILGRSGTDVMFGASGNDILVGRGGDDALFGGDGHDRLYGGSGDDFLRGGDGHDLLKGGRGDDSLEGGDDADWLFGGRGDDYMNGGDGDDYIVGGSGNDYINRSNGDDCIHGGHGDDTLEGGNGNDYISGGSGNDFISAGGGDDILIGGSGADTFFWEVGFGEGQDVVKDFEFGTDKVLFRLQSILDSTPGLADADGDPEFNLGKDLDASDLWIIQASEDGDVLVTLPEFSIEFDGIAYDPSITFEMLVDAGALDVF